MVLGFTGGAPQLFQAAITGLHSGVPGSSTLRIGELQCTGPALQGPVPSEHYQYRRARDERRRSTRARGVIPYTGCSPRRTRLVPIRARFLESTSRDRKRVVE